MASVVSREYLSFYSFSFQINAWQNFHDVVGYLMDIFDFGYLVSNGEEKGSRGREFSKIIGRKPKQSE